MDKEKDERIKQIKEEIEFYHEQAEMQNKQIKLSIETKKLFNKSFRYGMIIWIILLIFLSVFVVNNFKVLSLLKLSDVIWDSLNISVGCFIFSNSVSFIFASFFSNIEGYSKSRGIMIAFLGVLLAIVFVVSGMYHMSTLMGSVNLGP